MMRKVNCLKCKQKNSCCDFGAWVDLEEAKKISSLGLEGDFYHLEKDKDFPSGYKVGTSHEDNPCSFLTGKGLCAIHKVDYNLKPAHCKEFPYENGKLAPLAKVLCPMVKSILLEPSKRKAKKKQIYLIIAFFILPSLLLISQDGLSQETWREKIKQRWYNFSLQHDDIIRKYRVHLPLSYDGRLPTPVVIYLHGGGGSIKAAYKDEMDKASDKFGFILVVPAGTGPIPGRLLTWNGGKWPKGAGKEGFESCCGYAARNNIDDVGFISKMLEEVKNNFNVDENRIYATGISNGGIMSYRLACELSDKIAAIAPVAPPAVPANCVPGRPVAVMHIHGTADPCAPYDGGTGGGCLGAQKYAMHSAKEMVDIWKNINKCPGDSTITYQKGDVTCISYNKCADDTAVEFCTVEGGGHTWPSGSQYLPAGRIGPVSYNISFDQIWEFFKKHPKR